MMHYTHTPGGILFASSYFALNPPQSLLELTGGLMMGALGGLLPDIDHESSRITKKLGLLGKIISKICPHRGITHTILVWLIFWGIPYFYAPDFQVLWVTGFLGCLSHIVLDAMTARGVAMFYPLTKKKIRFSKIHTNSPLEGFVCGVIWLTNLWILSHVILGFVPEVV